MSQVEANGIRIEYEEFGDRQAPPLLLIMGLGGQMILWRDELCETLAARGHRVIRFDNRDVGKSTWFDHLGTPDVLGAVTAAMMRQPLDSAPYYLRDMAADTAGLLDALGIEQAHVVGASMGGMIAQSLAIGFPKKVRSLTSIMSTTGDPTLPQPKPEATSVLLTPQPDTREAAIERGVMVFRTIGSPGFPFDEEEVRRLATQSWERGANPTGVMRQLVAVLASGDRTEALRALRIPSLVIHGKEDPLVPVESGIATAKAIPEAKLVLIEGMGHDMPRPVWPQLVEEISALTATARH